MLIDCHTHAFEPTYLKLLRERVTLIDSNLDDGDPYKWSIHSQGGLNDLAKSMSQSGVKRYILLPVSGKKERVSDMNIWASKATITDPRIIPFGILHPLGDIENDLKLLLDLDLKGIKLHPFLQRFNITNERTYNLLKKIEEIKIPIILDTLFIPGLLEAKPHLRWAIEMYNSQGCGPNEIAYIATIHPNLVIIAAHGGSLYGWNYLTPLMKLSNVYFDISYLQGIISPKELVKIIRLKGAEKIMYGTDTPWCDPVDFRVWFEDLPLTSGEREQIQAGTILKILKML